MNVYLIEDDAIYAEFIQKSLSRNSAYRVKSFRSAEECLSAGNGLADAYIIDFNLPGKSGIDLFEAIRPNISHSSKVILMSALEDGTMVLRFIKKGIRDYVIKDDNVIESLSAILEGKEDEYYLFN